MLRSMEQGRLAHAFRELKRYSPRPSDPVPPPHALWRLGRWLAEKGRPRRARLPLQLFLQLYPCHQDRPEVLRDLARVLSASGQPARALAVAEQAFKLGQARDSRRGVARVAG